MVLLPGIVAILADSELVFLAISSDKFMIFETFTPGAGSNSFKVTTGPWLIFLILPLTPKSNKIFSKNSGSLFSFLSLNIPGLFVFALLLLLLLMLYFYVFALLVL